MINLWEFEPYRSRLGQASSAVIEVGIFVGYELLFHPWMRGEPNLQLDLIDNLINFNKKEEQKKLMEIGNERIIF